MSILERFKSLFNNGPDELVEYVYIDEKRLDSYSEQIGSAKVSNGEGALKLGWSPTGPSVSGEGSLKSRDSNTHEKITKLLKFLENKNLLLDNRPTNERDSNESRGKFFLEKMKATKVIFSKPEGLELHGLKDLAMWVSSPVSNPMERSHENVFRAEGVFLYLIESYWEKDGNYSMPLSGHSALKIVLEQMSDKFGLNLDAIKRQLTFREADTTPLALLKNAGFIVQSPRYITSLYRQRYLSDDQYVNIGGITQRCYDLFSYPIFITSQD